jgi:hypothetical protein
VQILALDLCDADIFLPVSFFLLFFLLVSLSLLSAWLASISRGLRRSPECQIPRRARERCGRSGRASGMRERRHALSLFMIWMRVASGASKLSVFEREGAFSEACAHRDEPFYVGGQKLCWQRCGSCKMASKPDQKTCSSIQLTVETWGRKMVFCACRGDDLWGLAEYCGSKLGGLGHLTPPYSTQGTFDSLIRTDSRLTGRECSGY